MGDKRMSMMKKLAISEIQRLEEEAKDRDVRMKLRVLKVAINSGLCCKLVGVIEDESGQMFSYAIGVHGMMGGSESYDPLNYIAVSELADNEKVRFERYVESVNVFYRLEDHERELYLDYLSAYYTAEAMNRKVAEFTPIPIELQIDREMLARTIYKSMRDNLEGQAKPEMENSEDGEVGR